MARSGELKEDLTRRMDGALETLRREFAGLRTGRASPGLLEPVRVEAYGSEVPLTQVGTIGVPEARMLTVQVWDRALVSAVERAIRDSNLGLNPASDGQIVRVPIPILTGERRVELAKAAARYAEGAKIAVRGVRRDGKDQIKALEKKHADQRRREQGLVRRGAEAHRRLHQADRRQPRGQGKRNQAGLMSTGRCLTRARAMPRRGSRPARGGARGVPRACRHHHGRQWPLGRRAPAAARRRPPRRRAGRAAHHRGSDPQRRRVADAVRLLQRELAPPGGRDHST